jgi:hypothetical protein
VPERSRAHFVIEGGEDGIDVLHTLIECSTCSAYVGDIEAHDLWHARRG